MGWVKCENLGGGWANVWHLSQTNKNTPRNPSLYFNLGGRYMHACFTNQKYNNHNIHFNSSFRLNFGEWYYVMQIL